MKIKSLVVLFPLVCAAVNAAPGQVPVYQLDYETAGAMSPRHVSDKGDEYAPLPIGGPKIVAKSETELVRQLQGVTDRGISSARIYANVPFADVNTVAALANKLRANAGTLESFTWYVRLYDANHPKNPWIFNGFLSHLLSEGPLPKLQDMTFADIKGFGHMEANLLATAMNNLPVLKNMELTGVQQGSSTGQKALMTGQLKPAVSSWFNMSQSLVSVNVNGNAFQRPGSTPYSMR